MRPLLRSEVRKLITVRSTWLFVTATVALSVLFVGSGVLFSSPRSATESRAAFADASGASIVALVLGIVSMTGEYVHATMSTTLLAAPVRTMALLAKAAVNMLAGAVGGLISVGVATAIMLPWLAAHPAHLAPSPGRLIVLGLAALANGALFGALGVGVGALLRSPALAIGTVLIVFFVAEPTLSAISPALGRYGLTAASAGLSGRDFPHVPPQGVGGLVLLGYAAALVALGALALERRDVS